MNSYDKALCKIEQDKKFQPSGCYIIGITGPIGPTGASGQQGIQGPTGPTGASGFTQTLSGLQIQLFNNEYMFIKQDAIIILNTIINNKTADINYDLNTGEFTFRKAGNYLVSWWLAVDGSEDTTDITISFTNGTQSIPSYLPIVTGQISGNAFITVNKASEIWTLRNTTSSGIVLASHPIRASITIVELQ